MKKTTNGVANVDTAQMEQARAQVIEQELSARSYKAYYEKMYYSLEAEKLETEYAKYKVRMQERLKKEKEEYEAFMKTLQENMKQVNADNQLGDLTIDSAIVEDEPSTTPVIQMNQ